MLHYRTSVLSILFATACVTSVCAQPVPVHTFTNPNSSNPDFFANAVAIDGNYALVGARTEDTGATDAGLAFLYDVTTGNLLRIADLSPAAGDNFGWSVAVRGDYVAIGAPSDNTGGNDAGRAFLFSASTGNLLHSFSGPGAAAGDRFGDSVAISGNHVLIAATFDRSFVLRGGQAFMFDARGSSASFKLRGRRLTVARASESDILHFEPQFALMKPAVAKTAIRYGFAA